MKELQIQQHNLAAKKLYAIKDRAFAFIGKNIGKISEYDVNKFILSEFKKEMMITQKEYQTQIIGFGRNTSIVHYYPKADNSRIIGKNDLVLIDIWARLDKKDAPFADITWMGYAGKNLPKEFSKIFKLVSEARNEVIKFLNKRLKNKKLPRSIEIEKSAREYFDKFGVEEFFTHGVGHSLGITKDHGTYFKFSKKSTSRVKKNIPFTIEPGLYFRNRFGVRSEINCYITEDYKLKITTEMQNKITEIQSKHEK